MKNKYIFPVIIEYNKEDGVYNITFPDFNNAFTFADSIEEINDSAKEVLELVLYDLEEQGKEIPKASEIKDINNKGTILLVEIWMPLIRDKFENKSIKKTLTIPKRLNDIAEKDNVNFSKLLQASLKEYLGIQSR